MEPGSVILLAVAAAAPVVLLDRRRSARDGRIRAALLAESEDTQRLGLGNPPAPSAEPDRPHLTGGDHLVRPVPAFSGQVGELQRSENVWQFGQRYGHAASKFRASGGFRGSGVPPE